MARKVTLQTKLKRGEIVRIRKNVFLGIVVKHEKFLGRSGFYAFNNSPGDKKFIREFGVDWYTRHHINDLVRMGAEIITRKELITIHGRRPSQGLKILISMTKRYPVH